MARVSKLKPTQLDDGNWRLNIPASFSESGTRQRLFFKTKKLAELEAERLKSMANLWGSTGRKIKASTAEDAAKATDILKGHDVSLAYLATRYVEDMAKLSRSKTFAEAWTLFEDTREQKSDEHKRTLARIGRKLTASIGKKMICDITHEQLEKALNKDFGSPHTFNLALRSASPAFNMAVTKGWAKENVCKRIEKIDTGRKKAVASLTLNQCRKVISACKDYRGDKSLHENLQVNCDAALPAIAIMLFAGVRPVETTRLDWENVDLDEGTILISNQKAKTDRSRFFDMPDTLKAWLELTPKHERIGSVCPPNWKRIIQAVRKKSGIGESGNDQLRKTFATMHLAHFKDVNLTRSIMGHESGDVIFTNYRGIVKPKTAAEFWSILPTVNEVTEESEAV